MGAQNFSDDTSGINNQDKSRKRNDIEREIVMREAELRKKLVEKTQMEAEIRQLKKEESRIRVELQEKQEWFSKMDFEILRQEEAIKHLRKDLYLVR